MQPTNPDTLLRRAVQRHLPLELREVDTRLTPAGIDWRPTGQRMVRAYFSHDPARNAPGAAPWRLSLVMRRRDDRTRTRSYWWDDAPDAAKIAALIQEVL